MSPPLSSLTGHDNYFEDFEVGAKIRHARGTTVGEVESQLLTKLVLNSADAHYNEQRMKSLGYGQRLVFGLVTGSIVAASEANLRDEVASIERLPLVLVNVPNVDKSRVFSDAVLEEAVADIRSSLGSEGRVLLRPSGTEPLVRVIVEAATKKRAEEVASVLAALVASRLALS